MEFEDEYVASGADVEVDVEVRKGHRSSIKGNTSPTQGSAMNIGAEEVRETTREATRHNQEELLQASEKKLHMTREREGIRCLDCMGKHLANECPLRKPRAPLSPPRNPKYCHICTRHGHNTDECFYNDIVIVPQNWPNCNLVYYPTPQNNQASLQKAYLPRPPAQLPTPTPFLPPQQPTYVQNYRPSVQTRFPQ